MSFKISRQEREVLRRAKLKSLLAETNRLRNQLETDLKDNDFFSLDYERFEAEFSQRLQNVRRCRELEE